MKKSLLVLMLLALAGTSLFADEPLLDPESYTTQTCGNFFLECNAEKKNAEIAEKRREDAFQKLKKTFSDFKNHIEDKDDKEKLSATVKKILKLYKNKKQIDSAREDYDEFEDGNVRLSLRHADGGAFKGAFGHSVKAVFYFRDGKSHINFFLCNDDCDLFINIAGGGKRENVIGFGSLDSDYQPEQEPARFYEFSSKTKKIRTSDFYWD